MRYLGMSIVVLLFSCSFTEVVAQQGNYTDNFGTNYTWNHSPLTQSTQVTGVVRGLGTYRATVYGDGNVYIVSDPYQSRARSSVPQGYFPAAQMNR